MAIDPLPIAYLDHAASTAVRPEAVEAMLPFLGVHHGNPSGAHAAARHARRAVDDARDAVAALVGAAPGEVVFTSGGTEADATALAGVVGARPGAILVGAIDHHAVGDGASAAARLGGTVHPLAVDDRGRVTAGGLGAALGAAPTPPTIVSVALANNEVGTIEDLDRLADELDRVAPGAVLHTDAVQAAPWLDLPVAARRAALVSLSAHKMGGPKGVGALIVRGDTPFAPLIRGGGQERGRRSGTQNVAGIVGFGVAARLVAEQRAAVAARVTAYRDRLATGLLSALGDEPIGEATQKHGPTPRRSQGETSGAARSYPRGSLAPMVAEVTETVVGPDGDRSHVLPGHLHLCLPGVAADEVLFLLDQEGVAASAASSCASGATESSHVLVGLGIDDRAARGSLRLTLGWSTTEAEVDHALGAVPQAVAAAVRTRVAQ